MFSLFYSNPLLISLLAFILLISFCTNKDSNPQKSPPIIKQNLENDNFYDEIGDLKELQRWIRSIDPKQDYMIEDLVYLERLKLENVEHIPNFIYRLKNLKVLYLRLSNFNTLPEGLSKLEKLEELSLSVCSFKEIPEEILALKNLKILDLSANMISFISPKIKLLKNLESLNLHGNELEKLPKELKQLQLLKIINLKHNQFNIFPEVLLELKKLRTLDFSENKLKNIPKGIEKLNMLKTINLEANSFSNLPKELGSLKNLRELDLSYNKISTLANEIGGLIKLQKLNLNYNILSFLPKEIGKLTNLKELILSENKLTKLPEEIGQLSKLEELNLSSNQIIKLPKEIGNLKNLKSLNLTSNNISKLPNEIFKLDLKDLDLYYTDLTTKDIKLIKEKLPKTNVYNKLPIHKSYKMNSKNIAYIKDADGFTNIRSGPGKKFNIIGRIDELFDLICVITSNKDWWEIQTIDGKKGFIHKSRIRIVYPNIIGLGNINEITDPDSIFFDKNEKRSIHSSFLVERTFFILKEYNNMYQIYFQDELAGNDTVYTEEFIIEKKYVQKID